MILQTSSPSPTPPDNQNVDQAWQFLNQHQQELAANDNGTTTVDEVDLKVLRRKIDWRIVPLMFLCYTMQFIDKLVLNYASVMGIKEDLHLVGQDFSNVATFLFVGLLCFEIPNIYFLQKFPAAKWLGANVICWGIATACGSAAYNYTTLLVSRIFLGIFEATVGPSLMLISSQWYTKSEQAPRFSLWYLGIGLGQILGGAVSFGFQHVQQVGGLAGWRIMFLVLGLVTVLIGIAVVLVLPDTPMGARWLSDREKVALLKHVSVNQTGIQSKKFEMRQILDALVDPQLYMLLLAVMLLSISSGVITTYSATIIRNLEFTPKQAALMNMPSGIVSIFFTLLVGYGVRKASNRWAWILACIFPAILGGALMSFAKGKSASLAGVYLVNAVVAPLAVFYNLTAANFGGSTKRAFGTAIISGSFSIGNIIGPQTFRAKDAPNYYPAKLALMCTQAGCAVVTVLLFGYYKWSNARREARAVTAAIATSAGVGGEGDVVKQGVAGEEDFMDKEVWASLTDRENERFRYSY